MLPPGQRAELSRGAPKTRSPETQQQSRRRGALVLRQKWSRGQVEARLANLPPCLVGMEACIGAHHLSRHPTGSAMPFRSAAVQKPDVNQGVVPFQQGATNGHPLLCSLPACCAVQAAWVVLAKVKPEGWEPLSRDRVGEVTLALLPSRPRASSRLFLPSAAIHSAPVLSPASPDQAGISPASRLWPVI